MIEIGQWRRTGKVLEQCGEYIGTEEIEKQFKAWKANKK